MAEPLNVLVAVLGGVRADHLSCSGSARDTTPFLNQVAREGVRFSHAFTTAPWTLPATAALLTGTFPATHGATGEHPLLSARHATLAQHLQAAGYRTAAFCTNPWICPETGCGRGFEAFFTQRHHNRLAARAVGYGRRASDALLRRADAGARRTNQALHRWLAAAAEPFLAWVHYEEARLGAPLPPPYERLFLLDGAPGPRARLSAGAGAAVGDGEAPDKEDAAAMAALYDGALRYLDTRLREVAGCLRERGLWERTLLVVTADHGTHLGERGLRGHDRGLADALLHVPLLLRCPARLPQGFVVEELAQSVDLLPTVLHVTGVAGDRGQLPGRPLIEGGRVTPGPEFTISERYRREVPASRQLRADAEAPLLDVRLKAIRTRREKFIWHSDEANELYDLRNDPREEDNLVDREPARAETLRRRLFDWLASVGRFEPYAPGAVAGGEAPPATGACAGAKDAGR